MMNKILTLCMILILTNCATENKSLISIPTCPPQPKPIEKIDIALVLGGGGSKGIAHIGALSVFEKYKIPINLIVGTSAGSAIGALYADRPDSEFIKDKLFNLKKWDILDPSILDTIRSVSSLTAPIRGYAYQKFFVDNLKNQNFEDLHIPFIAVTTDIDRNEEYIIRTGPIAPAINASSAIPPFFAPVDIYNRLLVDGGVIHPVPVAIAKKYNPKLTIAIDISAPPSKDMVTNIGNLTYKSICIFYYELSRMQSRMADVDIHPDLDGYGTFEDDRSEDLYEAGVRAAEESMPKILKLMKEKGITHKSPYIDYKNK